MTPREEEHARNVSEMAGRLAEALDCDPHTVEDLRQVGWYHDIGKIALSPETLTCTGPLSADQWNEIERHPEIGYRILNSVHEMTEFAEIILSHHERFDGTGYPKGLAGERIPIEARILSICDAYDAMTTVRPYREAMSREEAIEELLAHAGTQFDPQIVSVFIEIF
jgi:putative nucleotidyltransferase with HDIG domain